MTISAIESSVDWISRLKFAAAILVLLVAVSATLLAGDPGPYDASWIVGP